MMAWPTCDSNIRVLVGVLSRPFLRVVKIRGARSLYAPRIGTQRIFEVRIERFANGLQIVTRIRCQQVAADERVNLCFAPLDPDTAQSVASALARTAHPFGGWRTTLWHHCNFRILFHRLHRLS